jgi:hypothetical protein
MTTGAACAAAAALTARPFLREFSSTDVPIGCGWLTAGGSFYFNTLIPGNANPTGYLYDGNFFAQPVCAGAR